LQVKEKVIDNEFVAYSLTANFATTDFATLRPYHVAYITGWKVFADALQPGTAVTHVQDAEQLFSLLANGRADVVLFERWQGGKILQSHKLPAHMLQPSLVNTAMFIYLHKKHAHLVEPAAKALQAMKADGTYQRIYTQTLLASKGN
jgi:polar amino acid transport system substrate-binding protein